MARIIPAYAGSTQEDSTKSEKLEGSSPHTRGAHLFGRKEARKGGDHPRIRGEHVPHMQACVAPTGIIPAYAGSTRNTSVVKNFNKGSSPHTRGARQFWLQD